MKAMDLVTREDLEYLVATRREFHQYPEIGFELERTVAMVREKLTEIGFDEILSYGPASASVYIGNPDAKLTVGVRADMDALPIEEKTGYAFSSKNPGAMHACGHDAHTAILLTLARVLKRNEEKLPCRVKLLFQPNEEGETSGAKSMVDNGAIDDVDMIIATHVENMIEAGKVGVCVGDAMAACDPITVVFHGKTAHAAAAENGVDALSMAIEAYHGMKALEKEVIGDRKHIFHFGMLRSGEAHNVVPDKATMKVSFRYFDMDMRNEMQEKCVALCEQIAARFGGTVEIDWQLSCPYVHNDEAICEKFLNSVRTIMPERIVDFPLKMSSEDFSWFLMEKPGILFRTCTRNEAKGCDTIAHCNDFRIDEDALQYGLYAFLQFILDQDA